MKFLKQMMFSLFFVSMSIVAQPNNNLAVSIPAVLETEHQELHVGLLNAIDSGGKTGVAAAQVEQLIETNYQAKEQNIFAVLNLLPKLATGKVTPDMKAYLPLADQAAVYYQTVQTNHQAIDAALDNLISAAEDENKPQYVDLANRWKEHEQLEDQILFPTAIVVGKYLRTQLKS